MSRLVSSYDTRASRRPERKAPRRPPILAQDTGADGGGDLIRTESRAGDQPGHLIGTLARSALNQFGRDLVGLQRDPVFTLMDASLGSRTGLEASAGAFPKNIRYAQRATLDN